VFFVVVLFLVWSLVFFRRNSCSFCRESGVFCNYRFFFVVWWFFSLESVAFLPEVLLFEWILVCFCNSFSCMEPGVFYWKYCVFFFFFCMESGGFAIIDFFLL